jgi:hypothetical protein
MPPAVRYEEPFYWWGPAWTTPAPLSLRDLLRNGTLDPWPAAILWAALARRRSLTVVSGPSRVGKTTILSALLTFLPPSTRRIYLRGSRESFAFLADPDVVPARTALLVNEISPHLPVYLWGPAVRQFLQAGRAPTGRGFTLLATAHAESAMELVALLTGSPLRVPTCEISALEYVAAVGRSRARGSGRSLQGIWRLRQTRQGLEIEDAPFLSPHSCNATCWDEFSPEELDARRRALVALRDGDALSLREWPWPTADVGDSPSAAP